MSLLDKFAESNSWETWSKTLVAELHEEIRKHMDAVILTELQRESVENQNEPS